MSSSIPSVSVFCPTYNHEKYIRQCLENLVRQRTVFPIEIFVQDDASVDNTPEIVKEYAAKYDFIIPVLHTENYYSRGKNINEYFLKNARGKYLAICEGDDYWTEPFKLQLQYDFLEQSPHLVGCFHDYSILDSNGNMLSERNILLKRELSQRDLIKKGALIPTASIMVRSSAMKDFLDFIQKINGGDRWLLALSARYGNYGYIDKVMSAYRIHHKGMYQGETTLKRYEKLFSDFYTMKKYNADLYKKYKEEFNTNIANSVSTMSILYFSSGRFGSYLKACLQYMAHFSFNRYDLRRMITHVLFPFAYIAYCKLVGKKYY